MTGTIRTNCCDCGQEFKVEVDFPDHNKGFKTTMAACPKCTLIQTVYDPHVYDDDGFIVRCDERR